MVCVDSTAVGRATHSTPMAEITGRATVTEPAAQAGNVLQGYNSFHRQKPPFKRILHAVHNGNCQNRNEKQGQGKCRIEVLKIQKCAQEKNN